VPATAVHRLAALNRLPAVQRQNLRLWKTCQEAFPQKTLQLIAKKAKINLSKLVFNSAK
jgi:hypothetical protein